MLGANLWVEKGLVNGSIGTVLRIIYCANQGPPALPAFVFCIFPDYTGPTFFPEHPNSFPVTPIKRTWTAGHTTLSRTSIPLDLAWGMTIHKSQGLTMAKAVIDIGHHEMTAGISFVALSRVQNINDLLVNNFTKEHITRLAINDQILQRKREETRLCDL
ncbi:ATP-dependent DNA helicase PIF1-like [Watersipora subatra]|uniref:ATP-dependent DNA helicase PIF1-like n=1 Tax=Watersipora subatra TaxID=2589382 RepID=UPI00355B31C6